MHHLLITNDKAKAAAPAIAVFLVDLFENQVSPPTATVATDEIRIFVPREIDFLGEVSIGG